MTLEVPLWMQAGGVDPEIEYSAVRDRALLRALLHQEGIMAPDVVFGALKVSQRGAGANFSVDVAAGPCAITGDDVADQGMYLCQSTAVENLVIPSPPVSGTRIHRVVARVRDKLHDGTQTTYDWVLEVLEDPDGSGPLAIPPSAISLATVSVAFDQTSVEDADITDTRLSAATISSKYPLVGADSARPPAAYESELIWRTDKGCYEVFTGGAWYEMARRDGGGSAWTTYTPTLTATTTNPTLGTGSTRSGRYIREGRKVTVLVNIKFGTSGTAAGSGFYEVTLPVDARAQTPGRQAIGSAYAWDNSGTDFADGIAFLDTGVQNRVRLSIDSTVVANGWPATWAANDELGFTVTYEAAS